MVKMTIFDFIKLNTMLKKVFFLIFLSSISIFRAEEGMLIPSVIAAFESDMKAMGMKLTAEQIYSVNSSSLKDAIIHFGGGCTAELVSSKGLLLTNHHCGYSQIQSHSSLENDYLKYGFWAKTLEEELPNPGLTATRIVRIEDVTQAALEGSWEVNSDTERQAIIQANIQNLISNAISGTHFVAEIKPFNYGNDYYMIVKEVFKDIRLVGTPPNSIGKFGGDTDNWVWPRHTGDFSVFRIYTGSNNKPADFAESNVPYTPLHFLPISFKDRQVGDFTMVYGFPGETEQHVSSAYLKFIVDLERPSRIAMREKSLSVIDAAMRASDEVRIKYAAKQASIANAYKKWIGQIDGLNRLNGVQVKLDWEIEYKEKAASNPDWQGLYGTVIDDLNTLVEKDSRWEYENSLAIEYLNVGPELFRLARGINDLVVNYEDYFSKGTLQAQIDKLKAGADGFFKNYDAQVDKQIFELLTQEYLSRKNNALFNQAYPDIHELTALVYNKSFLTSKERYLSFLDGFKEASLKKALKDPGLKLYVAIVTEYKEEVYPNFQTFDLKMTELLKLYVEGKYIMFPEEKHWADANSTLRITYGKLEGSAPTDGMMYTDHTTLDGVIAKYNTGNPDFELLPRMLELHENKEYGEYDQNGELWVCFTGSNHTTGGNSGSPVIDANGNLMGLNFDRTWESTMSDFMFDPSRCRNIVVDIRYVLWVMDIYSGAKHLVDEMVLVRD
jgi:hypothetical protein